MTEKIEITIEPAAIRLVAGSTAEVAARIKNLGQTIDQLTLTIDGLDNEWYTLPISSVALFPNDQDELRIILHPPKAADAKPGTYPFRVQVASQENPADSGSVEAAIEVGALLALQLDISPERLAGRTGEYDVTVTNPGHSEVEVDLEACDEKNRLRYRLEPRHLRVPGHAKAGSRLRVRLGPLAFFGGEKGIDFTVAAAPPPGEGEDVLDFCPHCGYQLRIAQEEAASQPSDSDSRLQTAYGRASGILDTLGRRLRPEHSEAPVFCPMCHVRLREGAVVATAQFVRTPWQKSLRRIRLRRIRLRRPRCPALSRQPVIETFRASSEDKREFKISWSVKRARAVKIGEDSVSAKGEMIIRPTHDMTCTLTATNKRKTASRTLEIAPLPLPSAKSSERIKAALSVSEIQADAGGAPVQAILQVQNLGEIVDKFLIELAGIDETWCIRSASSLALMPQATDQVQLSFQPPRKEGVRAGVYPFAVTVRSQTAPEDATTILGQIEVLPSPQFKIDIAPRRVSCRRKGKYRVNLINTGVSDLTFELAATDTEEVCKFQFKADDLKVRAWSSLEVPMAVKPKRTSFVGEPRRYDMTVTGKAAGCEPLTANCELNQQPIFRSWRAVLLWMRRAVVIVGVILLIYFAIKWGGGWSQLTSSPGDWGRQLWNTITGWF